MLNFWLKSFIFIIIQLFFFHGAFAANVTCKVSGATQNITFPISGSIHIGTDSPVGSIIYQTNIETPKNNTYQCWYTGTGQQAFFVESQTISLVGGGALVTGAGIPSKVYSTNIPGVGVRFYIWNNINSAIDKAGIIAWQDTRTVSKTTGLNAYAYVSITMTLVKTGDISPGLIDANSFPTLKMDVAFPNDSSVVSAPGFPFTYGLYHFSSGVSITSSTCQSHDFDVPLGKYEVKKFTVKGSVTDWIDSSIRLTNCPAFKGYYDSNSSITTNITGQQFPTSATRNKIRLRLAPNNTIIDSSNGIFAVDNIPGAATGVGIQIAKGDSGGSFFYFYTPETYEQAISTTASPFRIPLRARYIQTEDKVTAGLANGSMTFTLEYY